MWECLNAFSASVSAVRGSAAAGSPTSGAMTVADYRYLYIYGFVMQVSLGSFELMVMSTRH